MLTKKEAQKLFEMYKEYVEKHLSETKDVNFSGILRQSLDLLEKQFDKIYDLTITLPFEEIIKIFNKYHIIQLRPLDQDPKLLLGCGNNPLTEMPARIDKHAHKGFVTIDPFLLDNPSVVGGFGVDDGLYELLPKDFYENLYSEAITIANTADKFDFIWLDCMKPDFELFELLYNGEEELQRSFLSSDLFWNPPADSNTTERYEAYINEREQQMQKKSPF